VEWRGPTRVEWRGPSRLLKSIGLFWKRAPLKRLYSHLLDTTTRAFPASWCTSFCLGVCHCSKTFWNSDYRQRFPPKSTNFWRFRIHILCVLSFHLQFEALSTPPAGTICFYIFCMYMHVHIYGYIHIHTYGYIHMYVYAYTYIYTLTCIWTYTYVYLASPLHPRIHEDTLQNTGDTRENVIWYVRGLSWKLLGNFGSLISSVCGTWRYSPRHSPCMRGNILTTRVCIHEDTLHNSLHVCITKLWPHMCVYMKVVLVYTRRFFFWNTYSRPHMYEETQQLKHRIEVWRVTHELFLHFFFCFFLKYVQQTTHVWRDTTTYTENRSVKSHAWIISTQTTHIDHTCMI